jgi:DNA topoisomerase I
MAEKKKHKLVVVESPTKARTIRAFLPDGYHVTASMGHVRDLPESAAEIPATHRGKEWARVGVDVEADFQPLYVVPGSKKKVIAELRDELRGANELILATDEDREGESIGWHLLETLRPKVPVSRIVFHEITEEAIEEALRHPRGVDQNLVRAQETRRILDRLVGYSVSPLLWKKISSGLSAGRVQSVAVRLLVERERERRAFHSGTYWDLTAQLGTAADARGETFRAELHSLGGKRIATGKDFDENTGRLAEGRDVLLLREEDAGALRERLEDAEWRVEGVERKEQVRRPAPPFTTSTLQQEANRKLRLSARDTMRIAQRLYEEGLITYMRTDSVHLSDQAMRASRGRIEAQYGKEYLSPQPRQYVTKSKGAQEAHEAIRPAGTEMRTVEEVGLTGREAALYELIWKRTVACQMADARLTQESATIAVEDARFRASGTRVDFPGFFRAYVEGSDDPDAALEDRSNPLPPLRQGEELRLRELTASGHETQPPARYTEASLVRTLEKEGVGRPSTYASIIGTIIDRGYVERVSNQLVPTYIAFAVTGLLEKWFPTLVDTAFTAGMEEQLDEIAAGKAEWLPYLRSFFLGEEGLDSLVRRGAEQIDPREASTVQLEGLEARVRIGRYGPFVESELDGETVTASLPEGIPPADLSAETVETITRAKSSGPTSLGDHPRTGEPVFLLDGRYGPYVQLGDGEGKEEKPKRVSLPKGLTPASVDLEAAVALLELPRDLGSHPETGEPVRAGIGRYGPYVVHGSDFRSLAAEDDVLTVELPRALELLAVPKKAARSSGTPLRTLGAHPSGGEVTVLSGRFGPYVKHEGTNATLPKGVTVEAVTLEQALELLAAREAAGGGKRGGGRKGAGKPVARKSAAKKSAAKKSGAKKSAGKAGGRKPRES